MKKGRKLVVAFLLFITVETLMYTVYYTDKESDTSSNPQPYSDHIPLSQPKKCRNQFFKPGAFNKTLQKVKHYPIGASGPFLQQLGLSGTIKVTAASIDLPVIVTAASSNHFSEVKALFSHLHEAVFPFTGQLKVVLFDLGLSKGHLKEIHDECRCEIRQFPFSQYPEHVAILWAFAWKPIVLQMMLAEFGFVMWMDSSVAVLDGTLLHTAFKVAKRHGIALSWSGDSNPTSLAGGTYTQTFDMLHEKPCSFRNKKEFYTTFIILYKTELVEEAIMRPWVSCGLTLGCMYIEDQYYTTCSKYDVYGECHHFDQSVLSIILNRLYYGRLKEIESPVPWAKCDGMRSLSHLPTFVNDFIYRRSKSKDCEGLR